MMEVIASRRSRPEEPPADRPAERHRRRTDPHAQRAHGPGLRDERLDRRSLRRQVRGRLDLGHGRPRRQGRRGGRHLRGGGHRALRHTSQGRRARHARWSPTSSAAPARARFSSTASRPTSCINMEHSNNTIANVCVGVVMVRFNCSAPELFFRYSAEARAALLERHRAADGDRAALGPSLDAHSARRLADVRAASRPARAFPTLTYDIIHREHYYYKNYTGHSTRECRDDHAVPHRARPDGGLDRRRPDACSRPASSATIPPSTATMEIPASGHRGRLEPGRPWSCRGPSAGEGAGRGSDAAPRASRPTSAPTAASATSATAMSFRRCGHPDRAVRAGRHPHLQGMADARRARTALRPGDGGQGRGPRDRQAMWMNHSRVEVPLCKT